MPYNLRLIRKWTAAGYDRRVGSDSVTEPAPRGFVRAYHLLPSEHAIGNLTRSHLKIATFSDLNDPFELLAMNFKEKGIRKLGRSAKVKFGSHTGLLCFSADWTNPVLWSHYGAKHRGMCLGFDLPAGLAQRVRYADERIQVALSDNGEIIASNTELEELVRCTKFRDWSYEEEFRIFVPLSEASKEGPLHFYQFGEDIRLREVILGPECTELLDSTRELVQSRHSGAVVFKARLAFKSFRVVADERTVP